MASFELFVAVRYLLARRRQAFISLISAISTLGVAVGVMALIIALALMTGLQGELRDRLLGATAHVYVVKTGGFVDYQAEVTELVGIDGVVGGAPAIVGKALVTTENGSQFITIKGIDPDLEPRVTDLGRVMQEGRIEAIEETGDDGLPGILLGSSLARTLNVRTGDPVTVLTPSGTLTPMGMMPRPRRARVAGVYDLGIFEFDSGYGFVSLDFARRIFGKDAVDMLQLRVDDIYAAPAVATAIERAMGPTYVAEDWADMNRSLFSALGLEKMAISITIGLIVMVAALNIVASLVLLVMEKSRDIAILKTMGATSATVMRIFMLQGLLIGLVGTVGGAAGGVALAEVLDRYRLIRIPSDVYQVSYVPFVVQPLDFAVVIGAALAICFLATLYPSRQASRLDPVQAIRYE
ncbi:MAG: FtsX-like permease family protein [Acidimicrobiia bacterium]|nr:FtsX-like permease family protein [Acidimicrobiia bacterium]